jgi:uncharacterized GH25 family protein
VNRPTTVLILGLSAWLLTRLVDAHDFWVEPNDYWVSPEALTALTLQVGHGPYRQRSPIPARRIVRFQALAPDGAMIDLQGRLRLGSVAEDGDFQLKFPGPYVFVLQTDNQAQTHLSSIRFNDYLEVEGLTPALQERARMHRMNADGSERYSRCAKAIVQVGPTGSAPNGRVEAPVGLPLEIVPEANPYAEPRNSTLPIRVLYEGHALAGALVKLTDLNHDAAPFEMHRTDYSGHASFTLPRSGKWLLNVIWTKALPRSDETDFETLFSSLSFGFSSDNP